MDPSWTFLLLAALLVVGLSWSLSVRATGDQRKTERRLAAIDRKLRLLMDHLGVVEPSPAMPDVERELDRGNKISAIKAYQAATGAGLKEAKDAVEDLQRRRA